MSSLSASQSSLRRLDSIHQVIVDGITWYKGKDLAKLIGAKHTAQVIRRHVPYGEHRRRLEEILPSGSNLDKWQRATMYLTEKGLKRVVAASHLLKSRKLAEELGCDIDTKIVRKEVTIVDFLQEFLDELKIKYDLQKQVGKYRIDLFVVDYNFCVEIDEHGHQDRDQHAELCREHFIRRTLNCDMLRVNPDEKDFSLPRLSAQIAAYLMEHRA